MNIELFDDRDLKIIESLEFNPSEEPHYDPLRGCLTWEDEYDPRLSSAGHQLLYSLWTARAQIHLGKPLNSMILGGDYYKALWEKAVKSGIKWPGFNRIEISDEDRRFLEEMLREAEDADSI